MNREKDNFLGNIPDDWKSLRLKFIKASPLMYGANESATFEDRSWPRFIRITDVSENGSLREDTFKSLPEQVARPYLLRDGDLLLARSGATVGKAILYRAVWGRACFAGYLIRLRVDLNKATPKYVSYFCQTKTYWAEIESSTIKATIQNFSAERYGNIFLPLPSVDVQSSIANFLDRKTAAIDTLIEKKQRLIELLQEKRQALITQAVTKGLDPDVPMKDSGIEWLGKVPEHWQVMPLMRLTPPDRKIMYGIVLPGPDVDEGVLIVKGGDVRPERLSADRLCRTTYEIESKYARARLAGGDIVYAIRGSIGDAEIVPEEISGANITQDAARVSPVKEVDNQWLLFALKSSPVFAQMESRALGATIRGVNIRDLKRAMIPVPPNEEQRLISRTLSRVTKKIDDIDTSSRRGLERLVEYRQALISAAVTGKIEVGSRAQ